MGLKTQNGWRLRMMGMFAVFLLATLPNPRRMNFFSFCIVEQLFSIPCPVCGITRSVHSFFCGRMGESLNYNSAGPLVAMVCLFFCLYFLLTLIFDKRNMIQWKIEILVFKLINTFVFSMIIAIWLVNA